MESSYSYVRHNAEEKSLIPYLSNQAKFLGPLKVLLLILLFFLPGFNIGSGCISASLLIISVFIMFSHYVFLVNPSSKEKKLNPLPKKQVYIKESGELVSLLSFYLRPHFYFRLFRYNL